MAETVVEILEVIEIHHQEAQGGAITARPSKLAIHRLFHVSTVEQSRQLIAGRLLAQLLAQPEVRK